MAEGTGTGTPVGAPICLYASVGLLRMHIDKTSTSDDAVLLQILTAATINIDRAVGRYREGFSYFCAPTDASAITYVGNGTDWLRTDPNVDVTEVAVKTAYTEDDYTAWAATDWASCTGARKHPHYDTLPYRAIIVTPNSNYAGFTSGYGHPTVRVTAKWGFSASPPGDIVEACVMQSARWYKRLQSGMSDVLASEGLGTLLYQKALDPDVRRILIDGRYVESMWLGL